MDIEVNVEYLDGDTTVKRKMKQKDLGVLLLEENIVLLFVNKPQIIRCGRKKK